MAPRLNSIVASLVLLALTTAAGCVADESSTTRQVGDTEPRAVVLFLPGSVPDTPLTADRTRPDARVTNPGWRVSVVDLTTGDESVVASGTHIDPSVQSPGSLSPDGRRLLVTAPEGSGVPYAYILETVDLTSGETTRSCEPLVESWGWDGSTIVACVAPTSPPGINPDETDWGRSGIIEITERGVTTRTSPASPEPRAADDSADPTATPRRLRYLGAYQGTEYFQSAATYAAGEWFGEDVSAVYRLRPGAKGLELENALEQSFYPIEPASPGETVVRRSLLPAGRLGRSNYPAHLAEGLLPVLRTEYVVDGGEALPRRRGRPHPVVRPVRETTSTLEVYSLETGALTRSVALDAPGDPLDRVSQAAFDPALTAFATVRALTASQAPELGSWLCETDIATGELTPLARVGESIASTATPAPLGYIGADHDILFVASAEEPDVYRLMLYDRSDGAAREVTRFFGRYARPGGDAVLLGGTSFSP